METDSRHGGGGGGCENSPFVAYEEAKTSRFTATSSLTYSFDQFLKASGDRLQENSWIH